MSYEGISIILSGLALLFSMWATKKANEYKDIEKRLNKLEIEEKIENKNNKLKANIKVIYLGNNWFSITNNGEITAENVDIANINIDKRKISNYNYFPLKRLKPGEEKNFFIERVKDLKKINVKLSWEDEFGEKFNTPREYKKEFEL